MQEPTFAETLAVFRPCPARPSAFLARLSALRRGMAACIDTATPTWARRSAAATSPLPLHPAPPALPRQRAPVRLRILNKIPMASWQAVYPDKLLQFKPLDGLRLDLISVLGIAAVVAQVGHLQKRCLLFGQLPWASLPALPCGIGCAFMSSHVMPLSLPLSRRCLSRLISMSKYNNQHLFGQLALQCALSSWPLPVLPPSALMTGMTAPHRPW